MTTPIAPAAAMLDTLPQAKPANAEDAAKQFEALLVGQMLRSMREASADDNGDSDSTGETMMDVADQQFSKLLASNGGMGLAKMIVKGLNQQQDAEHSQHKD
ncbi:MAG: rod-binding protein [Bryobacteraceae bacterium]